MAESRPSLVPEGAESSYDRWIEGVGNGAHVIIHGGQGYSLIWPDDAPINKHDRRNEALAMRGVQSQMAKQSAKKL